MPDPIIPPVPVLPVSPTEAQTAAYFQQVAIYNAALLEPARVAALQAQAVAMQAQADAATRNAAALESSVEALNAPPPAPGPRKFTRAEVALACLAAMPESTAATEDTMAESAKRRADSFAKRYPESMQG